jgi:hypothetical protein
LKGDNGFVSLGGRGGGLETSMTSEMLEETVIGEVNVVGDEEGEGLR